MKAVFCILLLAFTTSAFPWSRYDPYSNSLNQEQQQKLEELQHRLKQTEFQRQLESEFQENAAREAADEARREAEERAQEAIEQADQATADIRNEMLRSKVRTKTTSICSDYRC